MVFGAEIHSGEVFFVERRFFSLHDPIFLVFLDFQRLV